MAEEVDPGKGAEAPMEPAESAPVPEAGPAQGAPASAGSWSWTLLGLALVAVLLTVAGVFALTRPVPGTMSLGLGLLLWGLLDLAAQRRGLVVWKGPQAAVGNAVNLTRALALLALGVWLCMMAVGLVSAVNPAVIIWTGVCLATLYLAAALIIEMLVAGLRLGAQAFLLAALLLMLASYYYFSMPFTYSWAAVFACLSFAAAAWSARTGVLSESPFLSLAVLLAVLLLSTPLLTYTYQQAYGVEEQPLFTPTLLVPRMRQVVGGLSGDAGQIQWSPVHTQAGQPGDVRFSDKVAFVDRDRGQECVKLYQQQEDGLREILRVRTAADTSLTAFSDDGSRLAYTSSAPGKSPALYVLEPLSGAEAAAAARTAAAVLAAPRAPFSFKHFFTWLKAVFRAQAEPEPADTGSLPYGSRLLYTGVAPGPAHGQVWRALGRELYFSAPPGGPRNPAGSILRADFAGGGVGTLRPGRALPAVSPDGRSLLSVGFVPRHRYLEIADERVVDGQERASDARVFQPLDEASYFPAWNGAQTEVLYIGSGTRNLMIMDSNGRNRRVFDPKALDSKHWSTAKQVPFTLQWVEVGDTYSIYRSDPDGSGEKLIYETESQDISAPQWSADGERVAFIIRNVGGESKVVTVGSDGSWPRHFFTTRDSLDELKWSPDSLKVAWICRRQDTGSQEIWTAGYEGLDPVLVHADDGGLQDLTWSPAGKHLAVQQTKAWHFLGLRLIKPDLQNVLMVSLVDRHARVMTRYGLLSRDPSFSPHGDAIAYFTDQHAWNPRLLRERTSALVISQLY